MFNKNIYFNFKTKESKLFSTFFPYSKTIFHFFPIFTFIYVACLGIKLDNYMPCTMFES